MTRDPVCGMLVDERQAAAKAEYQGTVYYFCSPGCHKAFSADPRKYFTLVSPHGSGGGKHGE